MTTKPRSKNIPLFLIAAILVINSACFLLTDTRSNLEVPLQKTLIGTSVAPPILTSTRELSFYTSTTESVSAIEESILILSPLMGEHVQGKVMINGIADPAFEQNLAISLLDAGGQELLRTNMFISADVGTRGPFSAEITLPASLPPQPLMIQVFSSSPKDGSLIHLSSVIVYLDSKIDPITVAPNPDERMVFSPYYPEDDIEGKIIVQGSASGLFENTLNYAICGEEYGTMPDIICGTIENRLAEGFITTDAPEMGSPGGFKISLDDMVFPRSSTIVIYSVSPMNGAVEHAASRKLFPVE